MLPIRCDAGVRRGLQVGRVVRHRHQQKCDEQKRHADAQQPVGQKGPGAFAVQARPDEQPRDQKEKRHQKDVEPGAEQVEAHPALAVDNREGAPQKRRLIEGEGLRR